MTTRPAPRQPDGGTGSAAPESLTARLAVEGLHCMSCVLRLQSALEDVPGVVSADVDLGSRVATVVYEPGAAAVDDLAAAVTAAGYRVAG